MAHCDVLFVPSAEEMYGTNTTTLHLDLGNLDKVMEGAHRPGHFQGVCVVVKKLFDIIEPTKAYFGEKDFQQLAIIKHMVKTLKIPVEIIPCPTVREANGLAMSSRNKLLTAEERKNAAQIYKTLFEARARMEEWKNGRMESSIPSNIPSFQHSIEVLKKWAANQINSNPFLQIEYFEIVNAETLMPVHSVNDAKNLPSSELRQTSLRACIAVKVGNVRLIDNVAL